MDVYVTTGCFTELSLGEKKVKPASQPAIGAMSVASETLAN